MFHAGVPQEVKAERYHRARRFRMVIFATLPPANLAYADASRNNTKNTEIYINTGRFNSPHRQTPLKAYGRKYRTFGCFCFLSKFALDDFRARVLCEIPRGKAAMFALRGLHCMGCIAWVAFICTGCIARVALHGLRCTGCIAWVALRWLHCMGCIARVALNWLHCIALRPLLEEMRTT